MRGLVFLLLWWLAPASFAGYQGIGGCFDTLSEAATTYAVAWTGQCGNGGCRILSYTPVSGAAQVIVGGKIETYTITVCSAPPVVLPSGQLPTPWYASDTGTVSACGSTVGTSGGVSGGGGGGTVSGVVRLYEPTDEEKRASFEDGATAGGFIFAACAVVYAIVLIRRGL